MHFVKCAPRIRGDDPCQHRETTRECPVLPAYAGMILRAQLSGLEWVKCSPHTRG